MCTLTHLTRTPQDWSCSSQTSVTHMHMEWRTLTQERVRREVDKIGPRWSGEGHDWINIQISNLFTYIWPFLSANPSVFPYLLFPRSPKYFLSLPLVYTQEFHGKSWGIPKCSSPATHNVSFLWEATPLSLKKTDLWSQMLLMRIHWDGLCAWTLGLVALLGQLWEGTGQGVYSLGSLIWVSCLLFSLCSLGVQTSFHHIT